ncbi:MAG: maturase, partial [Actinobacteria bacterium]|nr:maturase [Actinomycetota bacterium]
SPEKTLITHARTRAARFLGYDIIVQHSDNKITRGRRSINGRIGLRVPAAVLKAKCAPYLKRGKPAHRTDRQNLDDYDIVKTYGSEYRGIAQYYLLALDVHRLNQLCWVAETSMLKTLAAKHKSTVTKMAAKHKAKIETPHGLRTCFEARIERDGKQPLIARFGGIALKRNKDAILTDRIPARVIYPRKELVNRLLKKRCELCHEPGTMQVHHVSKLDQLGKPGPGHPAWAALMAKRRRKTLVVCQPCHDHIHHTTPTAKHTT